MKPKQNKLPEHNYYFDHLPESQYHAIYQKGQFIDFNTKEPIELKEGAYLRILVGNAFILKKDIEKHLRREQKQVFGPNEEFYFDLKIKGIGNYTFKVKNKENIIAIKIGNKLPRFDYTSCEVFYGEDSYQKPLIGFVPIQASSFNEAYIRISEKYCLGKAAHTCNVYKTFFHKNKVMLDSYREAAF